MGEDDPAVKGGKENFLGEAFARVLLKAGVKQYGAGGCTGGQTVDGSCVAEAREIDGQTGANLIVGKLSSGGNH